MFKSLLIDICVLWATWLEVCDMLCNDIHLIYQDVSERLDDSIVSFNDSLHKCIPVNAFTKILCPYLLGNAFMPVVFKFMNSSMWMCCLLIVYYYGAVSVIPSVWMISTSFLYTSTTLAKWRAKQADYKAVGLK